MDSKIAGREVVFEIVEWCDDRMREEVRPGDGVLGVKLGIKVDRYECCKKRRGYRCKKGKRSSYVSKSIMLVG